MPSPFLCLGCQLPIQLDVAGCSVKRKRELGLEFGAEYRVLGLCLMVGGEIWGTGLLSPYGITLPTDMSMESHLRSVISSSPHSQGLSSSSGPCSGLSLQQTACRGDIGICVTNCHRDQGRPIARNGSATECRLMAYLIFLGLWAPCRAVPVSLSSFPEP